MIYPQFFAEFYDFIYSRIRTKTDHSFFLDQLQKSEGSALEIGVGTGRFFIDALNAGVDIYGIDNSPAMLSILRQKINAKEHHRVSEQNATNFTLDKNFKLVIAPFRVFSHIIETENQLKALDKIYDHLLPGASFIFDLFVPNLKLLTDGLDNFLDFDEEYEPGKRLKRYVSLKADHVNQISTVSMKLEWGEVNNRKNETWTFPFRFFFRHEIEHLIARSKFELQEIYGDYNNSPLNSDSKEFVIVCKKVD